MPLQRENGSPGGEENGRLRRKKNRDVRGEEVISGSRGLDLKIRKVLVNWEEKLLDTGRESWGGDGMQDACARVGGGWRGRLEEARTGCGAHKYPKHPINKAKIDTSTLREEKSKTY